MNTAYTVFHKGMALIGKAAVALPAQLDPDVPYLAFNASSKDWASRLVGWGYKLTGLGKASDFIHAQVVFYRNRQWQTFGFTPLGCRLEPLKDWLVLQRFYGSKLAFVKLPSHQLDNLALKKHIQQFTPYSWPKLTLWLTQQLTGLKTSHPGDTGHLCADGALSVLKASPLLPSSRQRITPQQVFNRVSRQQKPFYIQL